jgi:hypothetical protein
VGTLPPAYLARRRRWEAAIGARLGPDLPTVHAPHA